MDNALKRIWKGYSFIYLVLSRFSIGFILHSFILRKVLIKNNCVDY